MSILRILLMIEAKVVFISPLPIGIPNVGLILSKDETWQDPCRSLQLLTKVNLLMIIYLYEMRCTGRWREDKKPEQRKKQILKTKTSLSHTTMSFSSLTRWAQLLLLLFSYCFAEHFINYLIIYNFEFIYLQLQHCLLCAVPWEAHLYS